MTEKKNHSNGQKVVKLPTPKPQPSKPQSMAMPESSITRSREIEQLFSDGKKNKLKLDTDSYKPAKTRQQMYDELKKEEEILDQDVYYYAPVVKRGAALILDLAFMFLLYKVVLKAVPWEIKISEFCMNKYHLQFMFGHAALVKLFILINSLVATFYGIVMPVAFYNNTIGKKFLNLKVRGVDKYTLTISEAFIREIIYKPISIVCIAGFFVPFYNKEKQSVHDKLANTIVISA